MGLETATYLAGLTPTWPLSSDPKNQGDDHIRLLKSTLQGTFPNATKPFYFPSSQAHVSGTYNAVAADGYSQHYCTVPSADLTVNLPTLTVNDAGWYIELVKTGFTAFGVQILPPSGTIITMHGSVASMRLESVCEVVRLTWSGSSFIGTRAGSPIGTVMGSVAANFPFGWKYLNGASYTNTTYAELFAHLASSVLPNHLGRSEIGAGAAGSGLTARNLGQFYGEENHTLSSSEVPSLSVSGSFSGSASVTTSPWVLNNPNDAVTISVTGGGVGAGTSIASGGNMAKVVSTGSTSGSISGTASGGGGAHNVIHPVVGVYKIIKCA